MKITNCGTQSLKMRYIFNEIYFKIVLKKKKLEVNKIYGSYYPAFVIEYQIESTHLKENKINILWGGAFQDKVSLCTLGCPRTHSVH